MTVTMLLDLGTLPDESGGERSLGRYALSGFSFAYSPEEDAERPIALKAQLPEEAETGALQELRDQAVSIPDASLSLAMRDDAAAKPRPLVELALEQAVVDSVGEGRLVLRGAKVTAGSAAGLVGGLSDLAGGAAPGPVADPTAGPSAAPAPTAAPLPAPGTAATTEAPANAAPEPEAAVPTPSGAEVGAEGQGAETAYPDEPYFDAALAETDAAEDPGRSGDDPEAAGTEGEEDGLAVEQRPPAVT
jgi:hypothetical protein